MHIEQSKRDFVGNDDDVISTQLGNNFHRLDIAISEELQSAIRTLIHNKYVLDKVIRSNRTIHLCGELDGDDGYGPLQAPDFFLRVFPFVPKFCGISDSFPTLVPTNQTMGCSWRWRAEHLSEDMRRRYFELFTNPPPNSLRTHTGYLWIRQLGLLLPSEGKNRVDFLREQNVDWYPAWVTECTYPAPSRLTLYSVKVFGQSECWAVLDRRWVQRVPHAKWSKPILRAYGVSIVELWPHNFPSVRDVVAGFDRPDTHPEFMSQPMVDLDRIAADYAANNAVVTCSLIDLHGVLRLRSASLIWYWLGALTLSLLVVAYLLQPWNWSVVWTILAGAVMGAFLLPFLLFDRPVFRTTRTMTKQYWGHD